MTTDVGDFLQVIGKWLQVEWYRYAGGLSGSGAATPPLVVWRYEDPIMPRSDLILRAITSRQRTLDWYYNKVGRNWVLTPRRVLDEQETRNLPTDTAAIKLLSEEDQEFSRAALDEFLQIVDDLRTLVGTDRTRDC